MRSQLTTQVERNASNVPVVTLIDSYDAVGNRMTRSVNGVVATWTYDDLYRLTGQVKPGQVATYTLDGVGNLKTMWEGDLFPKTFTHDAADKITTMIEGADLTTYTWTGYGALASEVTGSATTAYSYSGQDQLIGLTDSAGVRSTYSFSGDGLRRTAQNGNVQPTTMVWDGSDYLLLNGPSSNTVVLRIGGEIVSAGTFDHLPDSLGSVIGDIRVGQHPRVIFDYWPYGTLADAAVKPGFPFLYVGSLGYYTDSTDRDYVRARELYKKLGRWMQVDPIWPVEHPYGYVNGDPVLLVDHTGLWPCIDPGSPPGGSVKCNKAWNKWIFDYCTYCHCMGPPFTDICSKTCDGYARTYYQECKKPGPGLGQFQPYPCFGGVIAPVRPLSSGACLSTGSPPIPTPMDCVNRATDVTAGQFYIGVCLRCCNTLPFPRQEDCVGTCRWAFGLWTQCQVNQFGGPKGALNKGRG